MKVEIISIGDELLIGQIINTNAVYLARQLTALGLEIRLITAVGDEAAALQQALREALDRSDVVIMTGGLGPTHDDITKEVVAEFFDSGYIFKPELLDRLRRAFERRGLEMAKINEDQARVPEKAEIIPNPVGSAPGFLFNREGKKCFVLPGIPAEMVAMCEGTIFPMLKQQELTLLQRTVRTTGIPESMLFERLGDIKELEKFAKVAFLPRSAGVDVRLMVKGSNPEECQDRLETALRIVHEKAGEYVYGYDDVEMEEVVAQLLRNTKQTVAVAESCTGGLLAHKLTNISGSSEYFERGVVSYSNQSKVELLGVPEAMLQEAGAVSSQTAVAMAEGIRKLSGADFGLSTTGIAGPTGGSKEKPVGLVYIGLASEQTSFAQSFQFFKDRLNNKERSVQAALELLRRELIKQG